MSAKERERSLYPSPGSAVRAMMLAWDAVLIGVG